MPDHPALTEGDERERRGADGAERLYEARLRRLPERELVHPTHVVLVFGSLGADIEVGLHGARAVYHER